VSKKENQGKLLWKLTPTKH